LRGDGGGLRLMLGLLATLAWWGGADIEEGKLARWWWI
jgi:hypothetical protein